VTPNGFSGSGGDSSPGRVRPYVVTGGRTRAPQDLALEALVTTSMRTREAAGDLAFERRTIARLCEQPRSVAEVASLVGLPLGVVRVLIADLTADGHLTVASPGAAASTDLDLLERVLDGVRSL
jgi:hypothetical protein